MVEQLNNSVIQLQSNLNNLESQVKSLPVIIEGTVTKAIENALSKTITPNTLKAFRCLTYKMVCDSIKETIVIDAQLSLDKLKSILEEWGLDLTNQEAGVRIENSIHPWTVVKNATVPLKNIKYNDSYIEVPLKDETVNIFPIALPFETGSILEEIKDIFQGNLEVSIEKTYSIKWKSDHLEIEKKYGLKKEIHIDDYNLQILKKIKEMVDKLGPFEAKLVLINYRKESERKNGFDYEDPEYDTGCVDVLLGMAVKTDCYFTARDLWFKIGNYLVWEEPRYSKATYIFKWPSVLLQAFIFRIRLSTLKDVRGDPSSGYLHSLKHGTKNHRSGWEIRLRNYVSK